MEHSSSESNTSNEALPTRGPLFSDRFVMNMRRFHKLLLVRQRLEEKDDARGDLSRALVVFLHATFEDMLRSLARERLTNADASALEKIALVGVARGTKFNLADLVAHRGKSVEQVLKESVEAHLATESFGSAAAVDRLLGLMALDSEPFKSLYVDLEAMMQRRHRIVHEADIRPGEITTAAWNIADEWQLTLWDVAVITFYSLLHVAIQPDNELHRWYVERRRETLEALRKARTIIATVDLRQPGTAMESMDLSLAQLRVALESMRHPSEVEILSIS